MRIWILGGMALCVGCQANGSASGGPPGSGSAGAKSGAESCGSGEFDVMDHCYRRVDAPEIRSSRAAVAADFDGDGRTDLVLTCEGEERPLALCFFPLNTAAPGFRLELDWSAGPLPHLQAADFDADGVSDVLVSSLYQFAVFSIDQGGFKEVSALAADADAVDIDDAYLYPALAVDLDQDGAAEVVTGSSFNGLRVWRFDGMVAGWVPSGDRLPLFGCGDLADGKVADLDGDGLPELVAIGSHNNCDANVQPGPGWNRVSVFTANGLELAPALDFPAEVAARRIKLAELDGDGIDDLVVVESEDMMVFRGAGDRSFLQPTLVSGLAKFDGTGPRTGDFDLDGLHEVLVEQKDYSYHLLVGLPSPEVVVMPEHIRTVLLLADLDDDDRPDLVTLAEGANDKYHPVLTLSGPG